MTDQQPEALRLVERLEDPVNAKLYLAPYIATELRRLHDDNRRLVETLNHVSEVRGQLKAQRDELLEVCKKFYGAIRILNDGPDASDEARARDMLVESFKAARATIAKAEGANND